MYVCYLHPKSDKTFDEQEKHTLRPTVSGRGYFIWKHINELLHAI